MAHQGYPHEHAHHTRKEPIQLDTTREKLIMRPDARLPKFFPAPKAIQITPIYDDDSDIEHAAAAFYPPNTSRSRSRSRSLAPSRLTASHTAPITSTSRPGSTYTYMAQHRARSHTPGRRAVYTDSEYDYNDDGYGSESSWGRGEDDRAGERSRSASRVGGAYRDGSYGPGPGYGGRRSYSSDSGKRSRTRTRSGYDDYGYDDGGYSRSRPGTMYSGHGYTPGSAYDDDGGGSYAPRSRPENALTPSGKPYSQTPQPHSMSMAGSTSGHSHGHGQGQGQQMPQSASASAYALSLAQSASGGNDNRRSRLPNALTPSGKPYSQTPQPHSMSAGGGGVGYTPSMHSQSQRMNSNNSLQPVIQVPGSAMSSHSHGGGGRGGGIGRGAFGGYQPTLPPPSAHSHHSQGGHVPSHTHSHTHQRHRSSSSLSSTGRSGGGDDDSDSSSTSVHRFTIQSPSSIAPTHVSYGGTPSSHAGPGFPSSRHGGSGSMYGGGGGGASRPISTYSYAGGGASRGGGRGGGGGPSGRPPSQFSYAAPPGSIMSASSAPSVAMGHSGGGGDRGKGFFDAIERYLKVLPTNPNFCWSNCNGRKKAVCIGINYVGQKDELNGCANDARNIRKFLISTYGFKSEDILLILDEKNSSSRSTPKPTKREMFNAMAWLVRGARIHDSLFFHYSGHGGQSTDASGKEIDGKDETIYPVDYDKDGDIIDDELYQALVKPLPAGCRLTAIFDSCHSGTVLDLPYLHSAHGRLRSMSHISKRAQKRGVAPGADVICFAACKDDETSADTFHGGVATGAMSYAFVQTLQQNPHMTYEELLMHLRDTLIPKYHQKAQISGTHPVDLGRPFTL